MYRVTVDSDSTRLLRQLEREIRRGPVLIGGSFPRLRLLYSELIDRFTQLERNLLTRLVVPIHGGKPELEGVPDRSLQRRVAAPENGTFPLEDLLLVNEFPTPERALTALFPGRERLASGVQVRFNDPKGLLSIGQIRATIEVLGRVPRGSKETDFLYIVERWPEHRTFRPAVLMLPEVQRAMIDVAQIEGRGDFGVVLEEALREAIASSWVALDPGFVSYDRTCVWSFNQAFWRFLGIWERVTGKSYQRALPKGKAESNHKEFIEEAASHFAAQVRELERDDSIQKDGELWIHERAPGSGEFTAGFLSHLRGSYPDHYRRMRVVLSDISPQVLDISARELHRQGHLPATSGGPQIFFRDLSATGDSSNLEVSGTTISLKHRFLYVRHANFFDQMPTRLFTKVAGQTYEVHVQATVNTEFLMRLEGRYGLRLSELQSLIMGQISLENVSEDGQARWIGFWSDLWLGVKLQERLEPVGDVTAYHAEGPIIERVFSATAEVRTFERHKTVERFSLQSPFARGKRRCHARRFREPTISVPADLSACRYTSERRFRGRQCDDRAIPRCHHLR